MFEYKINILVSDIEQILKETRPDAKNPNCRILSGDYMPIFNKEISNAEKQQIKIIPKSSVVYANGTTKYNTVFLRINGYCKECYAYTRKQELSYCITIKQNPIGLDINFTEAFVSRKKDHSHQAISRIQNENDNQKQISADSADQIVQPSTSTKQPQLVQYQIRGKEERENIAKEIILNHNGSAKHYRLALIGRKIENVASEDVYSKIVSEYNNRNNISNNWLDNLLSNSTTMSCTVLSNKFNGYVQQIVVYPVFSLICFMQKQFECLKMTAYEDRILHIDATGGLVNVADRYQHYKKYSRFLTYFCYLKNAKTIDQTNGAVLLSEMTTSIQDVSQLTSFFFKTKFEYEKNNKDKFRFRMIVTDMCWALVHSIIDVLNRETVIEYSKSVFEMASGNMTLNQINSKSWLTSCAAHTMKRLAKSLQKFKFDQFKHRFMCYAFSILLNSKSLDMISENFKILCMIFLSKYRSKQLIESETKLKEIIRERPESFNALRKLIKRIEFNYYVLNNAQQDTTQAIEQMDIELGIDLNTNNSNENENVNENDQEYDDQDENDDKDEGENESEDDLSEQAIKKSIKSQSPFTDFFHKVHNNVFQSIDENDQSDLNDMYSPDFIHHFLDKFMPYSFLWASFTLQNTKFLRLTNGRIEKYNQFRKNKKNKNELPHKYLQDNMEMLLGSCDEYMKTVNNLNSKLIRPKAKRPIETVNESDEEEYHTAKESWNKQRTQITGPTSIGYQRAVDLDQCFTQTDKSKKQKLEQSPINSNETYYKLHNIDISQKSLEDLTSNQLLSDSIIDAYITCIIDRSNTYLFNYFDAVKIAMKGDFGCNKRTTKLSDFRYIIGPVLYYKHWTLFFADTMERKFMYIDSMGKRNVQKVFENWSKFWIYDDKPWKLHVVHHSIQKDSINCGVFVCKFTKMILSGASDLIFDTSLLNEIRTDIRKTIETNNDFKLI